MTIDSTSTRRSIILGAGTIAGALALTSCKERGSISTERLDSFFGYKSKYPSHGMEPNEAAWPSAALSTIKAALPTFNPKYIVLLRISSASAWEITVNHASFLRQEGFGNGSDGEDLARKLFNDVKTSANGKFRHLPPSGQHPQGKPYRIHTRSNPRNLVDIDGFEFFDSKQQVEIFIWLDFPQSLNSKVTINPRNLISFAPRTQKDNAAPENYRFLAREVATNNLNGKIIGIRNYYCNFDESNGTFVANQHPDPATPYFAMNIHFGLEGNGPNREVIPVVIDPDTGNGVGFEP